MPSFWMLPDCPLKLVLELRATMALALVKETMRQLRHSSCPDVGTHFALEKDAPRNKSKKPKEEERIGHYYGNFRPFEAKEN